MANLFEFLIAVDCFTAQWRDLSGSIGPSAVPAKERLSQKKSVGGEGEAHWDPLTRKGGSQFDVWARKGSKIDFFPWISEKGGLQSMFFPSALKKGGSIPWSLPKCQIIDIHSNDIPEGMCRILVSPCSPIYSTLLSSRNKIASVEWTGNYWACFSYLWHYKRLMM